MYHLWALLFSTGDHGEYFVNLFVPKLKFFNFFVLELKITEIVLSLKKTFVYLIAGLLTYSIYFLEG